MDSRQRVREMLDKNSLIIEIGPWFRPIAPKREGYNCLALDVFDTETLLKRAKDDKAIPTEQIPNIEAVDLVGSSVEIARLAEEHGCKGQVDFIVSSHNFEHIPDPISFLQGCAQTLKPGGSLIMIVPDKRVCFDHFRPYSTLGDWLEAYFDKRTKPTLKQVFEHHQLGAFHEGSGSFSIDVDSSRLTPFNNIKFGYDFWKSQVDSGNPGYHDAHCWTLTPSIFELIMLDLARLGLLDLTLSSIAGPEGCEFCVQLRNHSPSNETHLSQEQYFHRRVELMRAMTDEQAENSNLVHRLKAEISHIQNGPLKETLSRLLAIESSRSWRVTGPLRRLLGRVRRAVSAR